MTTFDLVRSCRGRKAAFHVVLLLAAALRPAVCWYNRLMIHSSIINIISTARTIGTVFSGRVVLAFMHAVSFLLHSACQSKVGLPRT